MSGEALVLTCPMVLPFDWSSVLGYLALHVTPGVDAVVDGHYFRVHSSGDAAGVVVVHCEEGTSQLSIVIPPSLRHAHPEILARVRHTFDCDAPAAEIACHLARDLKLAPLVARHPGQRVPGGWDGFEVTVRTLLGQQVSIRGATLLMERLVEKFGSSVTPEIPDVEATRGVNRVALRRLFPSPDVLARADLSGLGIVSSRISALKSVAHALLDGSLNFHEPSMPNVEQRLLAIKGIGPWTTQCVLMRVMHDADAFPATDLAIKRLLARGFDDSRWKPWRAYATMVLWQHYLSGEINA